MTTTIPTRLLPEVGPIYRAAVAFVRISPEGVDGRFLVALKCGHIIEATTRASRHICRACKKECGA